MLHKVFVYGTLRRTGILEQALGEHHAHQYKPAMAIGVVIRHEVAAGETWPTLWPIPHARARGDVILVTDDELMKLDRWEAHYVRRSVLTDSGDAFTYVFQRKIR